MNRLVVMILSFVTLSYSLISPIAAQIQAKIDGRKLNAIFSEVSAESGLIFRHYNGMTGKMHLPEIMGSGSALFDYDNDGDLDVFFVQSATLEPGKLAGETLFPLQNNEIPRGKLFRNDLIVDQNGNRELRFTDVTDKSKIDARGYGFGAITGDINNDGFTDLYICNLGANQLLLNNGNGTFTDITIKSKADDSRWSIGGSFFDYDRDGLLDLIVINYADFSVSSSPKCFSPNTSPDYCGPKAFRSVGNSVFKNKGDGAFEDVSSASGISKEFGHGLGVVSADLNDDGWIDLYVANDGDQNQLWINQKNGTFVNEALLSGTAVNRNGQAEASMGVDANDVDGNGFTDIFITHLMEETHTLYLNFGDLFFEDQTRELNIGLPGKRFTGFGTSFFDFDNDGWLDLFIANGSVKLLGDLQKIGVSYPLGQRNQLFRNDGKGKFADYSETAGDNFKVPEVSRGASFGDLDNDGDTDIVVTNNNGIARFLRNNVGSQNNWIGLRLIGNTSKREQLGTEVEFVLNDKTTLRRRVRTDGSYSSAHDPRILAGLGKEKTVELLRIFWASGKTEVFNNPPINQYSEISEGFSLKK